MFEGFKIVELGMYLPLPYVGGFFANMGARVIKIEHPKSGDPLKEIDVSAYKYLNEKKEILYLDLKDSKKKEEMYKILLSADVVLDGFRRGFLSRLGFDYDEIKKTNPSCIYISLAGYERGLKDENKVGHDLNFVALSGIMQSFSGQNSPFPFQLADMAGALWAIIAVFYMLEKRRVTGEGGNCNLSLFRSLLSMFPFFYGASFGSDIDYGIFAGKFACYNFYETKDSKKLAFGCLEKKFFKRALEIIGVQFDEEKLYKREFQEELKRAIGNVIKEKEAAYWNEVFEKEDICVTPVLDKEAFFNYLNAQGVKNNIKDFLFSPLLKRG